NSFKKLSKLNKMFKSSDTPDAMDVAKKEGYSEIKIDGKKEAEMGKGDSDKDVFAKLKELNKGKKK
ncbi:hypothetical protein N9934_01075, partial [Desulfosarcina sp.]|nr:hypothetical protein [Desulfosarcina sp.]